MRNNKAQFDSAIDKLILQIEEAAKNTLKDIADIAITSAQQTTLFNNRLKESTHFVSSGAFSGEVVDDRSYAFYLEEGNNQQGPYIYPTRAKCLHFKINGQDIFAKRVRSHGPLPFVGNGRDQAASMVEQIASWHFKF